MTFRSYVPNSLYTALYGKGSHTSAQRGLPWGRPEGRIELSSRLRECPARARPRPCITGCPRLPDRTRRMLMFSCAVSACPIRGGGRGCKREDGRGRADGRGREGTREAVQHKHLHHAHMCVAPCWSHSMVLGPGLVVLHHRQADTYACTHTTILLETRGQFLSDSAAAGIHQQLISRTFRSVDLFQLV